VQEQLREEAEARLRNAAPDEKQAIEQWLRAKVSETLDADYGSCFMRDRRVDRCRSNQTFRRVAL
jgi:TorA maturation chaperone TorD